MTPSGLSPLGVVKHLAWVEQGWFRDTFAGEDLDRRRAPTNDFTFEVDPGDTVASVLAFYRDETGRARRITADASLDDRCARDHRTFGSVTMRWILVHMLEETARHAGHLDLMRERIDGRTGD